MTGKTEKQKNTVMLMLGVAVILILVILIAVTGILRKKKEAEIEESKRIEALRESESASVEASIEASIAESLAAEPKLSLTESTNPEILELVSAFFSCRLNADLPGLYALYGKEEAPEDEDLRAKLTAQKSWIRGYDDVRVYVLPGREEGEILGVVTYRLNLRRVNTKAPGIMYFYAALSDDGKWVLQENLLKETRDYIQESFEEAGVQELIDANSEELKNALSLDSDLALMYESFMNGEIYAEYNLDYEREQQVDLFMNPEDSVLID